MNRKIIFFILAWIISTSFTAATETPSDLKSTPTVNRLGLSLNEHSLSWKSDKGQTAYRILVATDKQKLRAGIGNLWDSGHRHSSESSNVPCLGKSFHDSETVWWKVQVWDEGGTASAFSEPSIIQVSNKQPVRNR